MEDVRITFEVAKLAKEKGFYEFYFAEYFDTKGNEYMGFSSNPHDYDDKCIKSSQSLLAKWLREVHKIIVISLPYTTEQGDMVWIWMIYKVESSTKYPLFFSSYEEALEVGLLKSLSLIK